MAVAIVSDEAGTTRDVIEVKLDLEGLPIVVSDTAGIREAVGRIEQEGVRRALERAGRADLVVWLEDAAEAKPVRLPEVVGPLGGDRLVVLSKADLAGDGLQVAPGAIAVSALTGQGLDELTRRLAEAARARLGDAGEGAAFRSHR